MNIVEAGMKGHLFRRKKWMIGTDPLDPLDMTFKLSFDDLMASDWETVERRVEVTRSEVKSALQELQLQYPLNDIEFNLLMEKIGL